jgi:4-amino-4-deoxychorismate lyase
LEKYAHQGAPLSELLVPDTTYKVRLVYDKLDCQITYAPYQLRPIKTLEIVDVPDFDYSHKYSDRTHLNQLKAASKADEIMICTGNVVRDSSYSNLVFAEGGKTKKLFTPARPLLQGTQRAALITAGEIEEIEILKADIQRFKHVYLVNAMMPLGTCRVRL